MLERAVCCALGFSQDAACVIIIKPAIEADLAAHWQQTRPADRQKVQKRLARSVGKFVRNSRSS